MKSNVKRNIVCILLIIILVVLFSIISIIPFRKIVSRVSLLSVENGSVRYIPNINDNFANDRVIVTLKAKYSGVNQHIDLKKFETSKIHITQEELSYQNSNILSNKIVIESVKDLMYISNPATIIKRDSFTQILSIGLKEHSKENVLKAIKNYVCEQRGEAHVTDDWVIIYGYYGKYNNAYVLSWCFADMAWGDGMYYVKVEDYVYENSGPGESVFVFE